MDLKSQIIFDIADTIHADVLPQRCIRCGFPLIKRHLQDMPFCWGCYTDRLTAQEGRTALLKARLAADGIVIVPEEKREVAIPFDQEWDPPSGAFATGQPL